MQTNSIDWGQNRKLSWFIKSEGSSAQKVKEWTDGWEIGKAFVDDLIISKIKTEKLITKSRTIVNGHTFEWDDVHEHKRARASKTDNCNIQF